MSKKTEEMMDSESMVKQQFQYFEWYLKGNSRDGLKNPLYHIFWSDLEKYLRLLRNQARKEAFLKAAEIVEKEILQIYLGHAGNFDSGARRACRDAIKAIRAEVGKL